MQSDDSDLSNNKYNYSVKQLEEKYASLLANKSSSRLLVFKLKRTSLNDTLGLGLAGNVDAKKSSVFVCNIYKDSIAYKHGLIKPGDQILEINGHTTCGIPHSDVTPLIRSINDLEMFIVVIR